MPLIDYNARSLPPDLRRPLTLATSDNLTSQCVSVGDGAGRADGLVQANTTEGNRWLIHCDRVSVGVAEKFLSQNNYRLAASELNDNRNYRSAIILSNVRQSNDDDDSGWFAPSSGRERTQTVRRIFTALGERPAVESVRWTDSRIASDEIAAWTRQAAAAAPRQTPNLTFIDFSDNRLTSVPWDVLDLVPNLRALILSRNTIETAAPPAAPTLRALQLQRLDLSGNNLSSLVLGDKTPFGDDSGAVGVFEQLIELMDLDLSHNQITDLPRSSFNGLTKLRFLNLASNRLSIIPFQVFHSVDLVQHLDLSHNQLVTFLDNFFVENKALNILSLRNNSMEKLTKYTFAGLDRLTHLDLSENRLLSIDRYSFDSLAELRVLNVARNKLMAVHVTLFQKLGHLEYLNLSNNNFKMLPNGVLSSQLRLEELIIEETGLLKLSNLAAGGPDEVSRDALRSLRTLVVRNNRQLHEIEPIAFRNLPAVQRMNLSGNALVVLPQEIGEVATLESLDVSHNQLISIPKQVAALKGLSSMSLLGNNFVCGCQMAWLPAWIDRLKARAQGKSTAPLNQLGRLRCQLGYRGDFLRVLQQLKCGKPALVHASESTMFLLRSDAQLDCVFSGNPVPDIIWVTPLNKVIRYYSDPDIKALIALDPANATGISPHQEHQAKSREKIEHQILQQNRLHFTGVADVAGVTLLENGSLRIHNISRRDSGLYTCYGYNIMGYVTAEIRCVVDSPGAEVEIGNTSCSRNLFTCFADSSSIRSSSIASKSEASLRAS